MKSFITAAAGLALIAASALGQDGKAAPGGAAELKSLKEKASYGIGVGIGKSFKAQFIDIDPDILARGIKDAVGGKTLLTDEQIREVMTEFQKEMLPKIKKAEEEQAAKVKKESEDFLAANKKQKGVVVLPSGLQYQILKEGTGKTPKSTDTVTVNYEGKLVDGTVFDSSAKNGGPATFQVDGVIKGWTEALQLMKAGSKWRLFIPSDLAYGATPRGGVIRPYDALIFDVELLEVK